MEDETVSLLNKPVNDLTVGDALKINLGILAVMVGVPLAIAGVATAKERVSSWRKERKARKAIEATNEQ